uniref:Uncharacterized protein n=1 Tax=viral metagenome TaxID=1070528 RepID=A0A6C0BS11_9ZZZZ
MEEINAPIFAQAKIEYTNQLIDVLYPHMFDGIKSIFDESKIIFTKKRSTVPIFILFREILEKVPIWNGEILDGECNRIISNSGCDWIDDLITAVFISHTKILTSIGPNQNSSKINVTIPKTNNFIHKCYINLAREIWKNPYLFNENVPGHEYQRNCKEVENIIKQCIETTIRKLLPVKEILREHLDTYDSEITNKEELKSIIQQELSSLKNELIKNNKVSDSESVDSNRNDNDYNDDYNDNNDFNQKETEETVLKTKINELIDTLKEDNNIEDNDDNYNIINNKYVSNYADELTDDEIEQNTSDIVVNDITIPVNENDLQYDNVDIMDLSNNSEIDNQKRLENLAITNEQNNLLTEDYYDKPYDISNDNISNDNISNDNISNDNTSNQIIQLDNISDIPPLKDTSPMLSENINDNSNQQSIFAESQSPPEPQPEPQPEDLFKTESQPESELKSESQPESEPEPQTEDLFKKEPEPQPEPQPEPEPGPEPKSKDEQNFFSFENIFKDSDDTKEGKSIEITNSEPLKEIPEKIEVKKIDTVIDNDIDETSSLANFFDDIKQIADDKKIDIDTSNDIPENFLFSDANESDK